MNKLNQILFTAVIATTFGLVSQANAQYQINEDDGVAASPRLRQMLNEKRSSSSATVTVPKYHAITNPVASVDYPVAENPGIAASPKTRQLLNEQARRSTAILPSTAVTSGRYQATAVDNIAASPRLRQQLNERSETIMIAPVK